MNKLPIIAALMVCVSFTGCVSEEPSDEMTIEEIYKDHWAAFNEGDYDRMCGHKIQQDYIWDLFVEVEGDRGDFFDKLEEKEEYETLRFGKGNEIEYCGDFYEDYIVSQQLQMKTNGYENWSMTGEIEEWGDIENVDVKASDSSGYIHRATFSETTCSIYVSGETGEKEEACNTDDGETNMFLKIGNRWGLCADCEDIYDASHFTVTFWVEKTSSEIYYIEVMDPSAEVNLASFTFFLKDESGSTYVGDNGFGEIAMQNMSGELYGIDAYYDGDDSGLQQRANDVYYDDGSEFPVHFFDNDGDGMLSSGDQFEVYGMSNSANGPAEDGWQLDIVDANGDIIGTAKLL